MTRAAPMTMLPADRPDRPTFTQRLGQVLAVAWAELSSWRYGLRRWPTVALALAPLALLTFAFTVRRIVDTPQLDEELRTFAEVFANFALPVALFFGALSLFMNLFRGEILDGSLHYYFLAPVRREVVVAGKYLAGLAFAIPLFAAASVAAALTPYASFGPGAMAEHLFRGPGLGYLVAYGSIAALAAVGYGAIFLTLGLVFRNPILPGLVLLGWETSNFLLPSPAKQISVMYYLKSLMPISISDGPFAIVSEPASPLQVVLGVFAVALLALVIAIVRVRRMDVNLGGE